MPQTWTRVNPAILAAATPMKGGTMIMATAAKMHLTIFTRRRKCRKAPGHPITKAAFASAAARTLGNPSRSARNAIISAAVKGKGPGKYTRYSKARPGSPLHGKTY